MKNTRLKNRKRNRLKGYDYSKNNFYFITICCFNRERFGGRIKNGEMILNEIDSKKILEKVRLNFHYCDEKNLLLYHQKKKVKISKGVFLLFYKRNREKVIVLCFY